MFRWDEENIRWLEEAAAVTNYYQKLAERIAPYLKHTDKLCEIGCGLGHLACAVAPEVKQVTAIDIDQLAIAKLREKISCGNIKNLIPVQENWLDFSINNQLAEQKFDVVLLSYINVFKESWEALRSLSKGLIIAILANGSSSIELANDQQEITREKHKEKIADIIPWLRENKLSYELIDCELEYGQPLASLEDAESYLARYYKADTSEIKEYLDQHLLVDGAKYYLPKKRKSGILIIDINS